MNYKDFIFQYTKDGTVHQKKVKSKVITIGRSTQCNITVSCDIISRRHLQISFEKTGIKVMDFGSTNGTFLNSQKLSANKKFPLDTKDKVIVKGAGQVCEFRIKNLNQKEQTGPEDQTTPLKPHWDRDNPKDANPLFFPDSKASGLAGDDARLESKEESFGSREQESGKRPLLGSEASGRDTTDLSEDDFPPFLGKDPGESGKDSGEFHKDFGGFDKKADEVFSGTMDFRSDEKHNDDHSISNIHREWNEGFRNLREGVLRKQNLFNKDESQWAEDGGEDRTPEVEMDLFDEKKEKRSFQMDHPEQGNFEGERKEGESLTNSKNFLEKDLSQDIGYDIFSDGDKKEEKGGYTDWSSKNKGGDVPSGNHDMVSEGELEELKSNIIREAETEAKNLIDSAHLKVEKIMEEAKEQEDNIVSQGKKQADRIINEAKEFSESQMKTSHESLENRKKKVNAEIQNLYTEMNKDKERLTRELGEMSQEVNRKIDLRVKEVERLEADASLRENSLTKKLEEMGRKIAEAKVKAETIVKEAELLAEKKITEAKIISKENAMSMDIELKRKLDDSKKRLLELEDQERKRIEKINNLESRLDEERKQQEAEIRKFKLQMENERESFETELNEMREKSMESAIQDSERTAKTVVAEKIEDAKKRAYEIVTQAHQQADEDLIKTQEEIDKRRRLADEEIQSLRVKTVKKFQQQREMIEEEENKRNEMRVILLQKELNEVLRVRIKPYLKDGSDMEKVSSMIKRTIDVIALKKIDKSFMEGEFSDVDRNLYQKKAKNFWLISGFSATVAVMILVSIPSIKRFAIETGRDIATEEIKQTNERIIKVKAANDLNKKYVPEKQDKYLSTYTDRVLYTRDYVPIELFEEYRKKWILELQEYFLVKLKLTENSMVPFIAQESSLIKELQLEMKKINGHFVDQGIARMRGIEEKFTDKLKSHFSKKGHYRKVMGFKKSFYEKNAENFRTKALSQ